MNVKSLWQTPHAPLPERYARPVYKSRWSSLGELRQIKIGFDSLTIWRKDYHFGVVRGNLVSVVVQNNVEAKVSVADRIAAEDWYAGKLQRFDEPVPLPKLNLKTLPTSGMRPGILPKL
jgi:hypothetical protein